MCSGYSIVVITVGSLPEHFCCLISHFKWPCQSDYFWAHVNQLLPFHSLFSLFPGNKASREELLLLRGFCWDHNILASLMAIDDLRLFLWQSCSFLVVRLNDHAEPMWCSGKSVWTVTSSHTFPG